MANQHQMLSYHASIQVIFCNDKWIKFKGLCRLPDWKSSYCDNVDHELDNLTDDLYDFWAAEYACPVFIVRQTDPNVQDEGTNESVLNQI